MIPNFQVSKHFSFYELTNTRHVGLQNQNREWAVPHLFKMKEFCEDVLEPIREHLGPMVITSGFRDQQVNEWVGGVKGSSHTLGIAVDWFKPEWNLQSCTESGWSIYSLLKAKNIAAKIIIEAKEGVFWIHINKFPTLCLYEGIAGVYKRLAD